MKSYFNSAVDSMSINKKRFSHTALICAEILIASLLISAQNTTAKISIDSTSPNIVQVKGVISKQSNLNWFFLKSVANADNLGARISDFQLFDERSRVVVVKKLADGEYLAASEATTFQYRINLEPLPNAAAKAHVSWISGEQGILMLDDLLPQFSANNQKAAVKISIELPTDWRIISGEKPAGDNIYAVENVSGAVFVVGKNWRETKTTNLNLAISGEWQFSDAAAAQMADEIYIEYVKLFGEIPHGKPQIILARLPKTAKFGRWEAETRGRTLTIFSAGKPFVSQSIQLLHEQLRHELFHLWIPNNLNLTGNYGWFYEGFTVYQALRTGVQMNQIRFEDFLATLAEAYNLDGFQTNKISLLESSKNRWNGANPQIYARGLIVAFLCEIAVLKTGGRRSLNDVFQKIHRKHRFPNGAADGSTAILDVLNEDKSLDSIIEQYIEGVGKINWETDLQAIGIETTSENSFIKLRVKTKPNGRQKDLLNKLGYNNWRKSSEKPK